MNISILEALNRRPIVYCSEWDAGWHTPPDIIILLMSKFFFFVTIDRTDSMDYMYFI